jgi:hypothetical protein
MMRILLFFVTKKNNMKKNIDFFSENVIAIINLIVILLNEYGFSKHLLKI